MKVTFGGMDGGAVSLETILQFCIGAKSIPAEGFFDYPHISFDHVTTNRLPSANTCVNALSFPVNTRLQEYNTFSEDMIRCLTECHGFGNV